MTLTMGILSRLVRKVKNFVTLDNGRRFRFVQAFILTGFYRAFILFMPFNKLKTKMGKVKTESPKEVDIEGHRKAREVRWAVLEAARHTPWESKCLVQALTASKMMKLKGISTTIYLGVRKNEKDEMLAHAWVRCGSFYITGGEIRSEYVVVAKFAS